MKLQEICDKIKLRHDFPHVLGDDFIIKTMFESLPDLVVNDELLGGLDLAPFDEMIMWPEPFPMDFDYFNDSIIIEPNIIIPDQFEAFDPKIYYMQSTGGWPATIADVMSK